MKIFKLLNKSENSIAILTFVAFLAVTIPYGFPIFTPLVLFFVILKILTGRFKIRINIGFIFFLFSILAYLFGILWNNGFYFSTNISEIINMISFLLIWILFSDLEENEYPKLIDNFANIIVFNGLIFSSLSIIKFIHLTGGVYWQWLFVDDLYPSGTSLVIDYNMFSMSMFASSLMALYKLNKKTTKILPFLYYFLTTSLCFFSIVLAGSRRGWIILFLVAIILFFVFAKRSLNVRKNGVKLAKYSTIIVYLSVFGFLMIQLFGIEFDILNSSEIQKMKMRFQTIQLDSSESGFDNRSERWDYAIELINDSKPFEVFFGSGFNYLTDYSTHFGTDIETDYPHNPFLSGILYSGIIGLIPLVSMVLWSFYQALKNARIISLYSVIVYGISFLYIFISSNSIFGIKPFFILMLLMLSIPIVRNRKKVHTY